MIKRYVCAVMRGRIHLDMYDTLRLKQTSLARISGAKCTILRKLCFIFAVFY